MSKDDEAPVDGSSRDIKRRRVSISAKENESDEDGVGSLVESTTSV